MECRKTESEAMSESKQGRCKYPNCGKSLDHVWHTTTKRLQVYLYNHAFEPAEPTPEKPQMIGQEIRNMINAKTEVNGWQEGELENLRDELESLLESVSVSCDPECTSLLAMAVAEISKPVSASSGQEPWLEFGPNTPPNPGTYLARLSSKDKAYMEWRDNRWLWDSGDGEPIQDFTASVTHYRGATQPVASGQEPKTERRWQCGNCHASLLNPILPPFVCPMCHAYNWSNLPDPLAAAQPVALTIADYEEVLADHRRLVRELDVLLNGEAGAAKQASLCDIVAQVRNRKLPAGDKGPRCPKCGSGELSIGDGIISCDCWTCELNGKTCIHCDLGKFAHKGMARYCPSPISPSAGKVEARPVEEAELWLKSQGMYFGGEKWYYANHQEVAKGLPVILAYFAEAYALAHTAELRAERDNALDLLGQAARAVGEVSGPVHERIRVFRQEYSDHIRAAEAENARIRTTTFKECCKAVCHACSLGREVVKYKGDFMHKVVDSREYFACIASEIYKRAAMASPDSTKENKG